MRRVGDKERGGQGEGETESPSPTHPLSPSPPLPLSGLRLCYVLLSPTWGMHQYAAGLANRMVMERCADGSPFEVHLVTTRNAPRDRYAPEVAVHTPAATRDAGFSLDGLRLRGLGDAKRAILGTNPDLVHFCGPHLWNPLLLGAMRRAGVPTVHTLHDLHPHTGAAYGRLLYLWNGWVRRGTGHLLVHGRCHAQELLREGMDPDRLTCTPLTHLFVGHAQARALEQAPPDVSHEPWALFLGRLEAYKGLDVLVGAARRLDPGRARVVIAGPGDLGSLVQGEIPANVEVRGRLIGDEEAVDLFRRCGLVVLPYVEASQSALVAAAYCFSKPVVVTNVGALPEYVVADGSGDRTGWVVPANDAGSLARVLQASLEDPERLARTGQAGRKWYENQRQTEGLALQEMYAAVAARRLESRSARALIGGK